MHITIGGMTATAQAGAETVTLAREMAPLGVDASRIAALERLARTSKPGLTAEALAAEIDAIEATPPLHSLLPLALSMAVASAGFSYLNGGDLLATVAAAVSGGLGQTARTLLSRKGYNQYAMTAALRRAGLGRLLPDRAGLRGAQLLARPCGGLHLVGAVPGARLPAGRGPARSRAASDDGRIARLLYAVALTLAAAAGLSIVAALAGLSPAPPGPPGLGIEPMTLLWRAVACFAGGCGYGILFNNPLRTVLVVALLTMVGNEIRLALHDLGFGLPSATFFGALAVGLGARWCASRCTCRASRSPCPASS